MKIRIKIITLLAGFFIFALQANAQKGQGDSTGMANRSDQPPVETISGELDSIKIGPCENTTGRAYIGTHLFLNTGEGNLLNIHLGASFAVESFVNDLTLGDKIEIQGYRTEIMAENNYIAKELTVNGKTIILRDDDLRPYWAGEHRSRRMGFGRFN